MHDMIARCWRKTLTAVAILLGVALLGAGPASAATAGWRMFDLNRDGWNETAINYNAAGRPTAVYQDTNRNGRYDLYIELDGASRPAFIWLDTNHNGGWDTRFRYVNGVPNDVLGNGYYEDGNWDSLYYFGTGQMWRYQNSSAGYGFRHQDSVYGLYWGEVSSQLTGRISSPSFSGDINMTLTKVIGLASVAHCVNFPWSASCR